MRILIFAALAILLMAATPKRVLKKDKEEYARYLAYCNDTIPVRTEQLGKIKLRKINGHYTDSLGNYTPVEPQVIYWYKIGTKKTVCEPNETLIHRYRAVWKKREIPSTVRFYEWWIPTQKQK